MNRKSIFTICSKNYLAQALTLKESVLKYEHDVDFFIFLADNVTDEIKDVDVVPLDEQWIPDWKEMAFKYDVIEFNTSIKPFCFEKLFHDGYEKVIYLDPDMFVVDKLTYIWESLDSYSIILTPHISNLETGDDGILNEEELLNSGTFNLGFAAIKNTSWGEKIVNWWCDKLEDGCLFSKTYFFDQKWMNLIPGYCPNELMVSRHFGLDVAYWNLHERELIYRNDKYFVKDINTGEEYPLLIYHFSGFDPFRDNVISHHYPKYNIKDYPSFKPIIQEYKTLEYKNGYEFFSNLKYAFNEYDNGCVILKLHRRLYWATLDEFRGEDPFSSNGCFYKNMEVSNLLSKSKNVSKSKNTRLTSADRTSKLRLMRPFAKFLIHIIGVEKFSLLLDRLGTACEMEAQTYLMQEMKKVDRFVLFSDRRK